MDISKLLELVGLDGALVLGIIGLTQAFKITWMKLRGRRAEPKAILLVPLVLGFAAALVQTWPFEVVAWLKASIGYSGAAVLAYMLLKKAKK